MNVQRWNDTDWLQQANGIKLSSNFKSVWSNHSSLSPGRNSLAVSEMNTKQNHACWCMEASWLNTNDYIDPYSTHMDQKSCLHLWAIHMAYKNIWTSFCSHIYACTFPQSFSPLSPQLPLSLSLSLTHTHTHTPERWQNRACPYLNIPATHTVHLRDRSA